MYRVDLADCLNYLKENDPTFYRVEKDYISGTVSMDSSGQGYRGISTYNSVMNGNVKEFVETCYPELFLQITIIIRSGTMWTITGWLLSWA